MRNFISEDDIEQAILAKLKAEPFNYDILICDADPSKRDDLNDCTGRASKKECVLPDVMLSSLKRINPTISEDKIKEIVKNLRQDYTGTDIVDTNYKIYRQIRNNIKITVRKDDKEDFDFVKLIDFEHPENNTFTAVSQMWIQGKVYYRRPDILIFINGMPLVFIELKNSIVKIEEAYNNNLKDYLRLDDGVMNTYFQVWMSHEDEILADLASAYVNRHLLKSITFDPKAVELKDLDFLSSLVEEAGFNPDYYTGIHSNYDLPYDFYRPSSEKPRTEIKILQKNGSLTELSVLSPLIKSLTGTIHGNSRFYFPKVMLENPEFTKYIVNDSLITDSIQPTEIADKAVSQQLSLDDNL